LLALVAPPQPAGGAVVDARLGGVTRRRAPCHETYHSARISAHCRDAADHRRPPACVSCMTNRFRFAERVPPSKINSLQFAKLVCEITR
jgi:hypothetical protein